MADWCLLAKKLALANGRIIDTTRAQIIKDELLADDKIDKKEFAFLVALRREAHALDPEFDALIFKVVKNILLKDGAISLDETKWLQQLFMSDRKIDEGERRFLKELKDSSNNNCAEFVDWCHSLGIDTPKRRRKSSKRNKLRMALKRLIRTADGETRWMRATLVGVLFLLVVFGGVAAGVFLLGRGNQGTTSTKLPPPKLVTAEHTIDQATIKGKQARSLEPIDSKTTCVFTKTIEFPIQHGENEVSFVERNLFESDRSVKMWLTIAPRSAEQGPLSQFEIEADVNGQIIPFGTIKSGKTEEHAARLKKNTQNPIQLKVKYLGKDAKIALQISWRDDPAAVKMHILGIGVSNYAKHSLGHNLNLKYADKDAEELVKILKEQAKDLFNEVRTKTLVNAQATKDSILREIKKIQNVAQEHDLVVLAFAGHGEEHPEDGRFCFLPHDYDPERLLESSAVSWTDFETYLRKMPCRVVVVMDACHSGAIHLGHRGGVQPSKDEIENALRAFSSTSQKRGLVVISACTKEQTARETDEWEHGALTKCLLDCLKSSKGIISLETLCHSAKMKMREMVGPEQAVVVQPSENLPLTNIPIAIGGSIP